MLERRGERDRPPRGRGRGGRGGYEPFSDRLFSNEIEEIHEERSRGRGGRGGFGRGGFGRGRGRGGFYGSGIAANLDRRTPGGLFGGYQYNLDSRLDDIARGHLDKPADIHTALEL